MDVELICEQKKSPSTTTSIWRLLLDSLSVENIPIFFNPMLDTFNPNILDLIDDLPAPKPIYDDKSLEMATLISNKQGITHSR